MPLPGHEGDEKTTSDMKDSSRRPPLSDPDGYFGDEVASRYDDDSLMFQAEMVNPTVDFLLSFCEGESALEFGIGTGRIALPLSSRGVTVSGIDMSRAMISRLQVKKGGDHVSTVVGDFASTTIDGRFPLVYLVFNTIMNLTSQREQVECFGNAAAHLIPGGHFVVEVMVPALRQLPPGQNIHPFEVNESHWGLDEYDTVSQGLVSHHLELTEEGLSRTSIPFRYVWPSELDLMAELSGMSLVERWADWNRNVFTEESTSHVSVWRKMD